MGMLSFIDVNKVLNSVEANEGADRLKHKIESGELVMDILPNSYEQFSGQLEANDYVEYCNFLKSHNGRIVLDMLEENDDRTYVE